MDQLLVLDVESASFDAKDGIVEIAWLDILDSGEVIDQQRSLIKPPGAISPGAAGVHGITLDDVKDAPTLDEFMGTRFLDKEVLIIGHNCVTGDHEVRTRNGWIRIDQLKEGQEVIQWATDGELSYVEPIIFKKEYSGTMLEWNSNFHKGVYTPNHRIYSKKAANLDAPWDAISARQLAESAPNNYYIPCSGILGEENGPFQFSPDESRVLEMIRADANIEHYPTIGIKFKFKKAHKISRCMTLLSKIGQDFTTGTAPNEVHTIRLRKSDFVFRIANALGVGKSKRYGEWVTKLKVESRQAILDELKYWDGYKHKENNGQVRISSSKPEDVLWIAELARLTGMSAKTKLDVPNIRGLSRSDGVIHHAMIRPRDKVKTLYRPTEFNFSGSVYCLSVPTEAFMVKRGGAVWITGNCSFDIKYLPSYFKKINSLCTLKLARKAWPKDPDGMPEEYVPPPDHKLPTLTHYLGLFQRRGTHNALDDCVAALNVLLKLGQAMNLDLEGLYELNNQPTLVKKMGFGKHKNKKLSEVPVDYIRWLLKEPNVDEDLRYSFAKLGYT